jgi:hypothetical protein
MFWYRLKIECLFASSAVVRNGGGKPPLHPAPSRPTAYPVKLRDNFCCSGIYQAGKGGVVSEISDVEWGKGFCPEYL